MAIAAAIFYYAVEPDTREAVGGKQDIIGVRPRPCLGVRGG